MTKKASAVTLLALLLSFVSISVQAQSREKRVADAHEQIKRLKDGVLLVRLQTRSKSLATIRERGLNERADEMEEEIRAENDEIIEAFRNEYDFSKVYFFNSEDSKHVREGNFEKIAFFDFNREVVDLDLKSTEFLTAEISHVQPDTARYKSDEVFTKTDDGMEKKSTYGGSTDFGFGALIIKSDQFIQLADPFPSYVRTFDTIFFLRRNPRKVVRKMNEKLHEFY